jgi:hypothetical protein
MKSVKQVLVLGATLLSTGVIAQVSLPFYDSFPTTYGVGNRLGDAPSSTLWSYGNSPGSYSPYFTNIDLSYPMLVDQVDLGVQVITNASGSNRDRGVALNYQPGVNFSGPLYFSYLLRVDQGAANRTNVISFTRNSSGTGGSITPGVAVFLEPNGQVSISKYDLANAVETGVSLSLEQTYLIVGRYTVVSGSDNDPFDIWINPSPATLGVPEASVPTPTLSITTGPDQTWLYGFYFTSKAGTTAWQGGAQFVVDDLRLGTTWADVTPVVPEPTTVLLSMLGGFGLLLLRLRRK